MRPNSSRPFRKVREYFGVVYTNVLLLVDFGAGVFGLKPKLSINLSSSEILEKSYKRVAIYAGYMNTESELSEAERILKLLSREFDLLILVNTGSSELRIDQPNFLYFGRENFGRDLASYKYALDFLQLQNTCELFFFNDSVLWTGNSVYNFLESARQKDWDVTALTSSEQNSFHLQSYALHLKGNIAELSEAFKAIRISNLKRVIVEAGEKRLSQYWLAKNVKIGGVYHQDSLNPFLVNYKDIYGQDYEYIVDLISQGVPLNPSIHFWAPLYAHSGIVKKTLLTKNPAQLKNVPQTLLGLQSKVKRNKSLS